MKILLCICFIGMCLASSASAAVTPLPTKTGWDYQLGGNSSLALGVSIVTRDRQAPIVSGAYNICYVNGFQAQEGELSWWKRYHRNLLLQRNGKVIIDRDWNEAILDIRTPQKRAALARIMSGWMQGCRNSGFQAVEPDNLDSWTRSRGLIRQSQTQAMAKLLIKAAHRRSLAIAQKNTPQLSRRRLGFDFAVSEECNVYNECDRYTDVYGARVLMVEYTDNFSPQQFTQACVKSSNPAALVYRDRDLQPSSSDTYAFRRC